ncbi:fimbrial protein [Aeromonas salmonicida]|uniref:fimbrial protein n=1 Tax=Aeromonas salmonicida TaxID=645 RepID=UPI0037ED0D1A
MYKLAFLLSTLFCGMMSTHVHAASRCALDVGSPYGMPIDLPNDMPIAVVDDGRYPSKINVVNADIATNVNGQKPAWRLKCTGEVWAYPDLYTHLPQDPNINSSTGWPNLQSTYATNLVGQYYYGVETAYNSPAGERLYWRGAPGTVLRGQAFKIGIGATPEKPVYVTLRDLGVDKITMTGYQTRAGRSGSFLWGAGGTVHHLRFYFRNTETDIDQSTYILADFRLNLRQVVMAKKTCGLSWNSTQHVVDFGSLNQNSFSGSAVGALSNAPKVSSFYLRCIKGTSLTYRLMATTPSNTNSLVLLKKPDGDIYSGYAILLKSRYGNEAFRTITSLNGGNALSPLTTMIGNYDYVSGRSADVIQVQSQLIRTAPAGSGSGGPFTATAMIEVNYQ